MAWKERYIAPLQSIWRGRQDSPPRSCLYQIMQLLDLSAPLPSLTSGFALLGFACDEGIRRNHGRVGAAEGPQSIREMVGRLSVHKSDLICYDAGDIICPDGNLELTQLALGEAVAKLLNLGLTPILLGGGHEMAYGHFLGLSQFAQNHSLGILNFDAHFDMRPLLPDHLGSSGTPFLQIATALEQADKRFDYSCIGIQPGANTAQLFATAKRYNVEMLMADELHDDNRTKCINFVNRIIFYNKYIYVSLCLDVFAQAYAPGVSAPQALGISPRQVIPLLHSLARSGKVLSYDLAELSPMLDVDQRTARLAAAMIHEILHHHIPIHSNG